jgi:hypothetical protein
MNLTKIYHDTIGNIPQDITPDGIPPVLQNTKKPDAARGQVKQQWLQSTITQELFASLNEQYEQLVQDAITHACTFSQHQNPYQIINRLVRANELRKLIKENSKL